MFELALWLGAPAGVVALFFDRFASACRLARIEDVSCGGAAAAAAGVGFAFPVSAEKSCGGVPVGVVDCTATQKVKY